MNNPFYKIILVMLFIILALQGKSIIDMNQSNREKSTKGESSESNTMNSITDNNIPAANSTTLNNLLELLYNKDRNININNINICDGGKTVELEIGIEGDLKSVEDIFVDLSSIEAFREVKKYSESKTEARKMYVVYNLKN
ncbi:MAG: hypothetical protein Q8930_00685 [Bacillota bacterium]|nr:hypothetical protein [Bacillota bacterium]